jgi:hypothetical protein
VTDVKKARFMLALGTLSLVAAQAGSGVFGCLFKATGLSDGGFW